MTWWHDAVVYQIYPRSFADSTGDGLGDLGGVRSRLPYLSDLGVNALWLSPFYPSPMVDGGYDVSDYCDVDPRFGTLADFDALVAESAALGIRIIVDLVPNHCSDQHPLFQEALAAGPGSPQRDRFIFREGRGDAPPNNWVSMFGGPAWTRVPDGQWYLHLFDSAQPDWDWRHPATAPMFEGILRFWLDRGVAGIRVDVAHGLFKDPDLPELVGDHPNNEPSAYYHRPELAEHYRTWRAILDSYPGGVFPGERTAVGEFWGDLPEHVWPYLRQGGLPQLFNFPFLATPWDAAKLRAIIDESLAASAPIPAAAPWVLGNHDVTRPVTRYSPDPATGTRRARAAALLVLGLPGSVYVYQGEELGLPEVVDLPDEARQDPTFFRTNGAKPGRDGCRVPLPWSGTAPPFGFTGGPRAWLPQPATWADLTVEAESADPGSHLSLYRAALALRPELGVGSFSWLDLGPTVLAFARGADFVFVANLGPDPVPVPSHREVLLASAELTESIPADTAVWLRP
ncbi:MAG: alpha-amylase family glycosyl hydrolase [Streptosporangiaceae bacterium]